MATDSLVIRDLGSSDDYEQCVALQRVTWGDDFRELVPPAMLQIVQKVGGVVAGAFEPGDRLVGFVFGLTGLRQGAIVHWSHMLAVREDRRDRGIGRRLKHYQRDRLREMGIDRIYWTFDPLVARNAHLNLNRLGARVVEYVEDMYGQDPMSRMDTGIGTDRFVVEWRLAAEPTAGEMAPRPPDAPLVATGVGGEPPGAGGSPLPDTEVVQVEVPADIQQLKGQSPDAALEWRAATRRAFGHYLDRGYSVQGLARDADTGRCFYVVRRGGR